MGFQTCLERSGGLLKKKTGNLPVEFKALRMFPDWERWITPKPTFLSDQLLKECAVLEEQGEPRNRVKRHNIFEHLQEGFQSHTLPNPPAVIQSFKEYKARSNLDPNKGNLWGCFWDACSVKEKGFWEEALRHNKTYSLTDDSKVYHPIKFGEDHPGYRPTGSEVPKDRPKDNDPRFYYHTDIKVWKTTQVSEERTLQVATDKIRSWLESPQNADAHLKIDFPPSQAEANQPSGGAKASGKGSRKRQSSVPPGSDTAKAKQARSAVDEKGKKGGKGKGRIPSIPKQALATTAGVLASKVTEMYSGLRPKDKRTILSQASEWYKAIYHTKFHMTKPQYLDHLCETAVRFLDVREPEKKFKDLMTKALRSLKSFVDDPTKAGLPDPNQTPPLEPIGQKRSATTTASRENPRTAKAKTSSGSYAEAITGKSASVTLPIGAKSAPAKTPAKYASGAIGAAVPPKGKAKAKAKGQGGSTPIGAPSKAKQGTAVGNEPVITSDSALEYLRNAPDNQSFDEYQSAQDMSAQPDTQTTQTVQDDQADQDEQIARAVQADLDAQAAQDATVIDPDQPGNLPDWDENDDAAMQQALVLSRKQTQPQGSDPQAASSAGAGQSTEQELNHELQVGLDYQTEVQNLQMKMTRGILHPDDVARYRTVSKLWSDNQARVAELFDRQVQENLNQQSQSTRAILGSLKPLNISRAKAPIVKPPPSSKDSTGASTIPAPGNRGGATDVRKAPPPVLGTGKPTVVKTPPQGPPVGPPKGTIPGARSVPIQGGLPAPASPKGSSQSHLIGKTVSPRGNPPPKVLRRPSGPSSAADGQTPRSVASEATAVLEEKLRKKKEAKRTRQDEQAEVYRDDRDRHKQQRSRHHQQEHRHTRDTRRRNRTPSQRSSSSETSDDDHRSPSSRGSRSRRREHTRHRRSRSRRDSRSQRRRRSSSEEEKRSRSKRRQGEHRSSKDKRRRDSSSSSQQQEVDSHEEDRNKSKSSQSVQAKAAESQNPPPLPPPDTVPTTALVCFNPAPADGSGSSSECSTSSKTGCPSSACNNTNCTSKWHCSGTTPDSQGSSAIAIPKTCSSCCTT